MEIDKKIILAGAVCASAVLMNVSNIHANSGVLIVNSAALNLREQPDKTSSTVKYLPKGAQLEYLSQEGEWYQVKYKDKKGDEYTGYVKQEFVEFYEAEVSNETQEVEVAAAISGNTAAVASLTTSERIVRYNLNFRTGPGTEYPVKKLIFGGTKVNYLGESNGWAKIEYNGEIGYVSSQYLAKTTANNTNSNQTTSSTTTTSKTRYVNVTSLNVRSGPGTGNSIVGAVYYGNSVKVESVENGWAKISYGQKSGYVNNSYLSDSIESSSTSDITKYVNSTALNVRSGPGTENSIVGAVYYGNSVKVESISNGWAKINYGGTTAYVSNEYLSDSIVSNGGSTSNITKYVNATSLNVRSGPGMEYSIIGGLRNKSTVKVESISGDWAKIIYYGKTAYVHKSYLVDSISDVGGGTTSGTTKYVNVTGLNVRSGPGTSYSIMGSIYYGNAVTVESISNGWAKIKFEGKTAYVADDYLDSTKPAGLPAVTNKDPQAVIAYAKTFLGIPYVWGGNGPNCFDCSGFTSYVYKHQAGITLPRHSSVQARYGTYVSRENLIPGDLVFFDTKGENDGVVSHVGIYIGNGQMIHASYSQGKIVITSFNSSYFQRTFVNGRRVL